MVTPRSLRRSLRRNPAAIRMAAGVLAGTVGMTTAAYGVFHVVKPYKGNTSWSEASPEKEASPTDGITGVLDIVLAELASSAPAEDSLLFSLPTTRTELVQSILDGSQAPINGVITGPPGGDGGGESDGGGSGLLPWAGGTITPPSGGDGDSGNGSRGVTVPTPNGGTTTIPPLPAPLCGIERPPLDPELGIGASQPAEDEHPVEQEQAVDGDDTASAEGDETADGCSEAEAPAPVALS